MTIKTTWRHETPDITEAFLFPKGRFTEAVKEVVVRKPRAPSKPHRSGPITKPLTIDGVLYKSIAVAERKLDISKGKIRKLIKDAGSRTISSKTVRLTVDGKGYANYKEASAGTGLSKNALLARVKRGGSKNISLSSMRREIPLVYKGIAYPSALEASRHLNVSYHILLKEAKRQLAESSDKSNERTDNESKV